jgi:hypothetical protein
VWFTSITRLYYAYYKDPCEILSFPLVCGLDDIISLSFTFSYFPFLYFLFFSFKTKTVFQVKLDNVLV